MTPKLSVIIPVRNGIKFVGQAIASAQAVPIAPLEILVVDDGSTDGTTELLLGLATEDDRIVVIRRDSDHGASAARNEGIARARADIICFLDADDLLYPEPVARRVEWLQAHPDIVLCFSKYQTMLPDGSIEPTFASYCPRFQKFIGSREGIVELGDGAFGLLYSENPICTTGTMARRDALVALDGFSRDLRQAEDWDLWIRLARRGAVAYSTSIEAQHSARPDSLSTNVEDRTRHIAEVARRHRGFALRHYPRAAFAALSLVEIARGEQHRQAHRNVAACGHYLAGFLLSPNTRYGLEFARSAAVVLGLRSGRIASFEERARIIAERQSESAAQRSTDRNEGPGRVA